MTYEVETRTLDEQETAVEYATLAVAEIGPWLGKVYTEVAAYLGRKGAGPAGPPFAYLSDPGSEPDPSTWRTEIVQPYRAP